jgi:hypothetical protein
LVEEEPGGYKRAEVPLSLFFAPAKAQTQKSATARRPGKISGYRPAEYIPKPSFGMKEPHFAELRLQLRNSF